MAATAMATEDRLDQTFAALANATRRAILARLVDGEATVNELAAPFDLQLPAISKHIKVLEQAGLVVRSRHAQFRPCRLAPDRIAEVAGWVDQYRAIWEQRFDRLDHQLAERRSRRQPTAPKGPENP